MDPMSSTSRVTLGGLAAAARHRWILVVIAAVLGVAAAGGLVLGATPRYEASTEVFVAAQETADNSQLLDGNTFTQERVASYARVATSQRVLVPVIARLRLDTSPADLAEKITATSPLNTVVIDITVSDPDAARAALIANAVTAEFVSVVQTLERPASGGATAVTLAVLQNASSPRHPASPHTAIDLILGLAGGLLVGLAAAVLRGSTDLPIRTEKDLEITSGLPVIGRITRDRRPGAQRTAGAPVSRWQSPDPQAEAIGRLCANVVFLALQDPTRNTMVITSAVPGEGRTTVAAELAIALANGGRSVALVDADLRHPGVAAYLGLDRSPGLSTVLGRGSDLGSAVQRWGGVPAGAGSPAAGSWDDGGVVDVLASGPTPSNPSEMLGSVRMTQLLAELARTHDHVLVDTPSVLPFADVALLARQVGGVLCVAAAGTSTRGQLTRAVQAVHRAGGQPVGIVFNKAPGRDSTPVRPRLPGAPSSTAPVRAAHRADVDPARSSDQLAMASAPGRAPVRTTEDR